MLLGHFPASFVPFLTSLIGIFSIVSCYCIAIHYHHEKPLPDTWISATAQHYPEFIIFRVGTISNGVLMILSYFLNHFYIRTVSYDNIIHINQYKPKITILLGTLGIFSLFVSTATIDTGKMNVKLHVACAGLFFLLTIMACVYNTFIYLMMYWHKRKAVKLWSLVVKVVLSLALILQAYLNETASALSSDLDHYLEFTTAFTIEGCFIMMGFDLQGYQMVYKQKQ